MARAKKKIEQTHPNPASAERDSNALWGNKSGGRTSDRVSPMLQEAPSESSVDAPSALNEADTGLIQQYELLRGNYAEFEDWIAGRDPDSLMDCNGWMGLFSTW